MQVAYDDGAGGEDIYDVHSDHLDTPKMVTDSAGAAVWRVAHSAYGEAVLDLGNTLADDFNIRFPGQYYDAETELHYNRFRYYDPGIGRYVSAEPIGQFGLVAMNGVSLSERAFAPGGPRRGAGVGFVGANLYGYALNHPVNLIDPDGQFAQVVGGFVGGAAAGGIVGGIVGGVRAAGQGGDAGDIIAGAATGAAIGAAVGGVTGAAVSVGVFTPLQVSAQQAAGATGLDLFISGAQFGFFGARLPGVVGAFASTLFGNPGDANGAEGGMCSVDTGPPGGDELAGEFIGGLGALNRR